MGCKGSPVQIRSPRSCFAVGELVNKELLEILACPICKGKLEYNKSGQELICKFHKLAFPIINGIPIMLEERARKIRG